MENIRKNNKKTFLLERLSLNEIFTSYYKDILKGYYLFNKSLYGEALLNDISLKRIEKNNITPLIVEFDPILKKSVCDIYDLLKGNEILCGLFLYDNGTKQLMAFGRTKEICESLSICEIICNGDVDNKIRRKLYKEFIKKVELYNCNNYDTLILDIPNNDESYNEIKDDLKYNLIEDSLYYMYPTKQYQKKLKKKKAKDINRIIDSPEYKDALKKVKRLI